MQAMHWPDKIMHSLAVYALLEINETAFRIFVIPPFLLFHFQCYLKYMLRWSRITK